MTALGLYEAALAGTVGPLVARTADGRRVRLPVERWLAPADPVDERVLEGARGPVLDVGCGPGRHTRALSRRGVPAVGVDVSSRAVRLARRGGAFALHASVFDRLPGSGGWRCVLLLDGNVGIGGSPTALLMRIGALLSADGEVLVEVEPPGPVADAAGLRLEHGRRRSFPLDWAFVGADTIGDHARAAGLRVGRCWCDGGRWFALLERA